MEENVGISDRIRGLTLIGIIIIFRDMVFWGLFLKIYVTQAQKPKNRLK